MNTKMDYRWRLRERMTERNLWKTTELVPLLAERGIHLSATQVYRLVTATPERLSLATLAALCDILACTPNDLIEPFTVATRATAVGADNIGASIDIDRTERAAPRPSRTRPATTVTQPACVRCARTGHRSSRRFPDGLVCPACHRAAHRRVGVCASCEHRRLLPGQHDGAGISASCAGIEGFVCLTCGANDTPMERRHQCPRCQLRGHLHDLLADTSPPTATAATLIDALCRTGQPRNITIFARRHPALIAALATIAANNEPLTHATIDTLGTTPSVTHLRDVLTAVGVLPARDRQLAAFDQWCHRVLSDITPATDRHLITSYATWHHRPRLARHVDNATLRPWSTRVARQQIRVATALLTWLRHQNTDLATCTQHHIDQWFATGPTTRNTTVGFLHWAQDQQLSPPLRIPTIHVALPDPMAHTDHVALIAHLLHDHTLHLIDRVAGLLSIVYAQPVSRLHTLRVDAIHTDHGHSTITIGTDHTPLAQPVADLVNELIATTQPDTPWLFPGRVPGHPISPSTLNQRLRTIGVTQTARVAALHDLIGQLPTTVLADALGYNPNFINERATNLATGWNTYAALPR